MNRVRLWLIRALLVFLGVIVGWCYSLRAADSQQFIDVHLAFQVLGPDGRQAVPLDGCIRIYQVGENRYYGNQAILIPVHTASMGTCRTNVRVAVAGALVQPLMDFLHPQASR